MSATKVFPKTRFVLPDTPLVSADVSRALYTKTQNYCVNKVSGGSYCAVCFENKPYRYTYFCRVCDRGVCGGCMNGLLKATPSYELCEPETFNSKELPKCPLCRSEGCFAPQGKRYARLRKRDEDNNYFGADITLDRFLRRAVNDLNAEVEKYEATLMEAEKQKQEIAEYNKRVLERQERKNINKEIDSFLKLKEDLMKQLEEVNDTIASLIDKRNTYDLDNLKDIPETVNKLWLFKDEDDFNNNEIKIVDYNANGGVERWGNSHQQVRWRFINDNFIRAQTFGQFESLPQNIQVAYNKVRKQLLELSNGERSVVLPRKPDYDKILSYVNEEEDIDAIIAKLQAKKKKFIVKK